MAQHTKKAAIVPTAASRIHSTIFRTMTTSNFCLLTLLIGNTEQGLGIVEQTPQFLMDAVGLARREGEVARPERSAFGRIVKISTGLSSTGPSLP